MIPSLRGCTTRRLLLQNSWAVLAPVSPPSCSTSAHRAPQRVFIENNIEDPVLVVAEDDDVDIIGPPDSVSNLRPIIRKRLNKESVLQQRLREMQDSTQLWNHKFWTNHNIKFVKERQQYIDTKQSECKGEKRQLTPEEMSEFYKAFLDRNWENHVKYNFEWYKRNFSLLFLSLRVSLEKNVTQKLHPR